MDCNKCFEIISLYIDGLLAEEEQIIFENHIENCEKCRIELHETETLLENLKDMSLEEMPEHLHFDIMKGIEDIRVTRRPSRFLYSRLAAFAASLIVVVGVLSVMRNIAPNSGAVQSHDALFAPASPMASMPPLEAEMSEGSFAQAGGRIAPDAAFAEIDMEYGFELYEALEIPSDAQGYMRSARQDDSFRGVVFEDGLVAIFDWDDSGDGSAAGFYINDFENHVTAAPIPWGLLDISVECDCEDECYFDCDCECYEELDQ
ncbi:MAG: zf-HC2 domain-containing protein [Defluviitaleaceae bacterium]|nr:zf-HC2 domain-containing protein [Defluviitaleaceae bacterium]